MKSKLKTAVHEVTRESVFEIWYDGKLIGRIYPRHGPRVLVLGKYEKTVAYTTDLESVQIAT
jgi:hypothetical protein